MSANVWLTNKCQLIEAFARMSEMSRGKIRTELLSRALSPLTTGPTRRILDVGGGFGELAYKLAEQGHEVTILDPCIEMLDRRSSRGRPTSVKAVSGRGEDIRNLDLGTFDIILCHSVIQYISDPRQLLNSISSVARDGAWLSLLAINPKSIAMREGLSKRWAAASSLLLGNDCDRSRYVQSYHHSLDDIDLMLKGTGFQPQNFFGVGIFTDHLEENLQVDEFADAVDTEWYAGITEPYRSVARSIHILAPKNGDGPSDR